MKENVLFINALNTLYLRLYGVGYKKNDQPDNDTENPLSSLHRLAIQEGIFTYTIPLTGWYTPQPMIDHL